MSNKIKYIFVSILFAILLLSNYFLISSYNKVQEQFDKQTSIVNKLIYSDSTVKTGQHNLLYILNKYMEGDDFVIDGKKVPASEFLSHHDVVLDSLKLYRAYYKFSQKHYGVRVRDRKVNDSITVFESNPFTRADSSDALYYFYKNRLSLKNGSWIVTETDYKTAFENCQKLTKEIEKHHSDVREKYNSLLVEQNSLKDSYAKLSKEFRELQSKVTEGKKTGATQPDK